MEMRKFVILFVLIGAILGTALAYKSNSYEPDFDLRNENVISQKVNHGDFESYKVTHFKGEKVFVRVFPAIFKKDDLIKYLEQRKRTSKYLSAKQPDRVVDVTITFNKKLSVEEFESFLGRYGLKATSFMYKSYPEGIGVFSSEVPRKLIKEMENDIKEGYIKHGYSDFKLIDGIVSFKTRVLAKDLIKLQNDPIVFLADSGPIEVYVENSDAEIFMAVDYIYPSYAKVW